MVYESIGGRIMNIRSIFEADNTVKKPVMGLHSYHSFAAAGFLLASLTFLGIALINKQNFAILIVLLILAAAAEVVLAVRFFGMIKGHTIQQADELAHQILYKAGRMTAGALIVIGGIIELIFALTDGSFTINSSNAAALFFGVCLLAAGLKSLFFILLDRTDAEEEE